MNDFSSTFGPTSTWVGVPARTARRSGVRVWDLPTRVFHWALLACVSGAVASALIGGNWMEWHLRFGAATLGLLAFRVVWGFIGPRYACFRSYVLAPRAVLAHLKSLPRSRERHAGHSPSGAASVVAMLLALGAMLLTGLLSSDSISTEGALVRFASEDLVGFATGLHHKLQWAIYGLVGLHVAAILAYLLTKKQNLVKAMIDGDTPHVRAPRAADSVGTRVVGFTLMAGSVLGALMLAGG